MARLVATAAQSNAPLEPVKVATPIDTVMVEDLLLPPGRYGRPSNIVVIIRGLPGSGKSHLARLIKVLQHIILCYLSHFHDYLLYHSFTINLGKRSVAGRISTKDTVHRRLLLDGRHRSGVE